MIRSEGKFRTGLHAVDQSVVERMGGEVALGANGFFYCTGGSVTLQLSDRSIDLCGGCLYLYPPYTHTVVTACSPDLKGVAGVADFDFVQAVLSLTSDTGTQLLLLSNPVARLDGEVRERFESLLAVMWERLEDGSSDKLRRLRLHALGEALCYEIIDIYFNEVRLQPKTADRADVVFRNFVQHLNENFRERREVQYYAGLQCLSPRYFSTIVRRCSGRTAYEWIATTVLNEAKRLLLLPDRSVKQVAMELNFANQSFFGSFFRQHAGCSPSAWRRDKREVDKTKNICIIAE